MALGAYLYCTDNPSASTRPILFGIALIAYALVQNAFFSIPELSLSELMSFRTPGMNYSMWLYALGIGAFSGAIIERFLRLGRGR